MNIFNKKRILTLSAMLLLAATAFTGASCSGESETTEKPGVAVTILPQAEFVEKVAGDLVDVTVMVPSGASPHTYEPTPSQMTELSKADMYAKVGSGVEFELTWMDKLIAQNSDMMVVDCSEGIQLQATVSTDEEHEHEAEETHEEEHDHGAMDPHIWMSPANVEVMVRNITEGLIEIDPDNQATYEANRDAYLQELSSLDTEIQSGLADVSTRVFMVYHPSFGYFASRYDLTMLPVEDEGKEPTAAGLQICIEQALEHGVKAVFASPQFNPQSAEVIADAIDGEVILIDPLAKDYTDNIRALRDALINVME